ncbi:MAG: hypothetical protein EOQ47_19430 [Mesorhizobium sp.]|nr:MAG: hypothetical protein EOQ47_19430 [Mesorhizobium sp.]
MRGLFVWGSKREARSPTLPISPLVGEMSGRTEGGAKELDVSGSGFLAPMKWGRGGSAKPRRRGGAPYEGPSPSASRPPLPRLWRGRGI